MPYDCYYDFHSTFSTSRLIFSFFLRFFSLYSTAKSFANCAEFLNFSMFFCNTNWWGFFFFCRSNWISCAELCTEFWFGLSLMCNKTECTKKFLTGQSRWHEVKRDIHFGTIRRAICESSAGAYKCSYRELSIYKVLRLRYN